MPGGPAHDFERLLLQAEEYLLLGRPRPAILECGNLCEAALAQILALKQGEKIDGLGQLLGKAREGGKLDADRHTDLNWLNKLRIVAAHFKPGAIEPSLDDASRAIEVAHRLLIDHALVEETHLEEIRQRASSSVCGPSQSDVYKLDRVAQRSRFDDLLDPPAAILGYVTDGEVEQGHEHFGRYVSWRLPKILKGRWRELVIEWPLASGPNSSRFAQLVESISLELLPGVALPSSDPEADRAGWAKHVEKIAARLRGSHERIFARHVLHGPASDDLQLMSDYLECVWRPLSAVPRPGTAVLGFDIVRAMPAGIPFLSRAWRVARREKKVAASLRQLLERFETVEGLKLRRLEELGSLSVRELAEWLRTERKTPKDVAEAQAIELHAASRGGRFDLVVQRVRTRTVVGDNRERA